DEPGVRASLDFDARKTGDVSNVTFDLEASVPALEKTRLGTRVAGAAELRASGTVALGRETTVDVEADLRASRVAEGDRRLDRAWLRAHARGPTDDPRIDAIFQGSGLSAGSM